MLAPTQRLRWVKINNGKYEITPAMLCKNGFAAILPDMTEDKVLAFKDDVEPSRKILWSALVAKRDAGELTPGQKYRITDYTTGTATEGTDSAGKRFDVIVEALSGSELSSRARACHHDWVDEPGSFTLVDGEERTDLSPYVSEEAILSENLYVFDMEVSMSSILAPDASGDRIPSMSITIDGEDIGTYYLVDTVQSGGKTYGKWVPLEYIENPSAATKYLLRVMMDPDFADCDVGAWELEYCLDNDATRFEWANASSGRGVIYRMVDEWGNDCPYDFKNIVFTSSQRFLRVYTFNCVKSSANADASLDGAGADGCSMNKMGPCFAANGKLRLGFNVMLSGSASLGAHGNEFGEGAYGNVLGAHYERVSLGAGVNGVSFAASATAAPIGYVKDVAVEGGCSSLLIYCDDTTESASNMLQNVHVHVGVSGKSLAVPDRGLAYSTDYYAAGSQTVLV